MKKKIFDSNTHNRRKLLNKEDSRFCQMLDREVCASEGCAGCVNQILSKNQKSYCLVNYEDDVYYKYNETGKKKESELQLQQQPEQIDMTKENILSFYLPCDHIGEMAAQAINKIFGRRIINGVD